jgi:hypothetical protein
LLRLRGGVTDVLGLGCIRYMAPADAGATTLPAGSVDYHVSYTVLEHIPPDDLKRVLREGTRLLAEDGKFIHLVDLSDHFSHSDRSLSRINFLKFTDEEWRSLAGNRFMYQNRLRVCDYERLFAELGIAAERASTIIDEHARRELSDGFPLAERFRGVDIDALATTSAHFVAR